MATLNLSDPEIDGSVAVEFDIAHATADTLDKVLAVVSKQGIAVLSKKCVNLFGSEDELKIEDGVGYTLKLTLDDCQLLAAKGVLTYKLNQIVAGEPVELFTGTIASGTPTDAIVPILGQKKSLYFKDAEATADLADYDNGDMLYDPATNDLKIKDDDEWKTVFNGA